MSSVLACILNFQRVSGDLFDKLRFTVYVCYVHIHVYIYIYTYSVRGHIWQKNCVYMTTVSLQCSRCFDRTGRSRRAGARATFCRKPQCRVHKHARRNLCWNLTHMHGQRTLQPPSQGTAMRISCVVSTFQGIALGFDHRICKEMTQPARKSTCSTCGER
jgi:hypothetical protein